MELKGFTPLEKQKISFNNAQVAERVIFAKREVVADHSKAYQQGYVLERLKELQEKEQNQTITKEEIGELFSISLGIND